MLGCNTKTHTLWISRIYGHELGHLALPKWICCGCNSLTVSSGSTPGSTCVNANSTLPSHPFPKTNVGTPAWSFMSSAELQWTAFVRTLLTGLTGHVSGLLWLWNVFYPALLFPHSPFTMPWHQDAGLALFCSLSLKSPQTYSSLSANVSWKTWTDIVRI